MLHGPTVNYSHCCMKPFSYYQELTVAYPTKQQYEKIYFYQKGKLIAIKEQFDYEFVEPPKCAKEVIFDEVSYQSHIKLYDEERLRLQNEFRCDLIEKYNMTGHPKANKCFDMAWDFGQSSSYSDVEDYFMNLIELVRSNSNVSMSTTTEAAGEDVIAC